MKRINKYIYLSLYILITVLIFILALRDYNESTNDSNFITDIIISFLNSLNLEDKIDASVISHIVRKLIGHFGLFFVCGFFGINTYLSFIKNKKISILLNLCSGFIIAVVSEVLQLIPIGRSCQFSDVLIDFSGYLLICILYIIFKRKSLVSNKKKKYTQKTL